jgi:hypothetical protein
MLKRITVAGVALALGLFAGVITAQKVPNSTAGAPLKGVDVKLGKNPGGSPAKRTTDGDGKIDWGNLSPGNYSVEIVPPAKSQTATNGDDAFFVVEISGPGVVGGTKRMAWEVAKKQFVTPIDETARTTTAPAYSPQFKFDVGSGPPAQVLTTIVRSKSNITNN